MSFAQDLKILYHLALSPVRGKTHAERLESFYAGQAAHYDEFRKKLLHGRQELYQRIPVPEDGVWVEMGGGTGFNLEYLGANVAKLKQVHVVDLSPSLLQIGKERVARQGWTNVALMNDDATTVTLPTPADVVTFSYSLTMIPNWFLAIQNALKMLRPGGIIAVVDFYVARKHPAPGFEKHAALTRWFWPAWFSCDNVFPSPDHLPYLHQLFEPLLLEEKAGKLRFLPLARVPYYLFMGRKPLQDAQP